MDKKKIGKWAFIVGLIIAILAGFFAIPQVALVLFILGIIVGFMNIGDKETDKYLIAIVALTVLGVASIQVLGVLGTAVGGFLNTILANFIAFVGASALVVSVKSIIELGK